MSSEATLDVGGALGTAEPDAAPAPTAQPTAGPRHARRRGGQTHPPSGSEHAVTGRYLPSLDGLRAFAVAGVLAYHLGFGWAAGGYLGVDLFFVLSGFLITSLLLEEWVGTARIRLAAFWTRRARRLLPALFLVLIAIALYVVLNGTFGTPGSNATIDLAGLRTDSLSTLFYFANWRFIFGHQPYFAHFTSPSPLLHTWSLAIEEQFYLIWPLVLLAVLTVGRRWWRQVGAAVTVCGTVASAGWMYVLFHHGADLNRLYFGTDTHAFDMLAGATVAMVVAARPQPGVVARRLLHAVALPAVVVLGVFWVTAGSAGQPPGYMFEGGFLLCAVLAALVIADVRQVSSGPLGYLLAVPPLRFIGQISYGIYLWHWPIIVYLTPQRTGLAQPWLDLVRVGLTIGISVASFYLVERPIRRRQWAGRLRYAIAPAAVVVTGACVVVATVPAIAAPTKQAPATAAVKVTAAHTDTVPGAGGFATQLPIHLLPGRVIDPAHPLRVMLMGDSVMDVAEPALAAALGATGEGTVINNTVPGFGFTTATNWRTSVPHLIATEHPDLVVGTWSWDNSCTSAQQMAGMLCALQDPVRYKAELEQFERLVLAPGDGVSGMVFLQFPTTGPAYASSPEQQAQTDADRAAGQGAFDRIVRTLPGDFPGRVMYLPVAASVLQHGAFATWLPPATQPKAPRADWVRVRMVDNVHLCPAGAVRYADAVLADLTTLYHLTPAEGSWWNGSWTSDPRYNSPPGSCPDDHPG